MSDRFNITTAETDREAILIRERDDARHSANIRGTGIRMAFVVIGLGFVLMLLLVNLYSGLKDGQRTGKAERRQQTAEQRTVTCFLARDDIEMALAIDPHDVTVKDVKEICEGYTTLDEAIESENSRDADGSLPGK